MVIYILSVLKFEISITYTTYVASIRLFVVLASIPRSFESIASYHNQSVDFGHFVFSGGGSEFKRDGGGL